MSKLAHSNQPTMDEIEAKRAERERFEAEAERDTKLAIRVGKQQREMLDGIFNHMFGSAK